MWPKQKGKDAEIAKKRDVRENKICRPSRYRSHREANYERRSVTSVLDRDLSLIFLISTSIKAKDGVGPWCRFLPLGCTTGLLYREENHLVEARKEAPFVVEISIVTHFHLEKHSKRRAGVVGVEQQLRILRGELRHE